MRKDAFIALAALAVFVAGGCKNNPMGPTAQSLFGTWQASKAEYVRATDSSVNADIVAGGSTITLVMIPSAFKLTINDARAPKNIITGCWTSYSGVLTLHLDGSSATIVFGEVLNGTTLTLNGGGMMFDFNSTGSFESAKLNLVLIKR